MSKEIEYICHVFIVSFLKKLQQSGLDFVFFHTPNGGKRGKVEAAKLKMMGVLAGVPDITIISGHGVGFLEFKKLTGTLSNDQLKFIGSMEAYKIPVFVIAADLPSDMIKKSVPYIAKILGIDQNAISSISASVLTSASLVAYEAKLATS